MGCQRGGIRGFPRPDDDIPVDDQGCRADEAPYVLRREGAVLVLDRYWESFLHVGGVPG